MESIDPMIYARAETGAPALTRGLAILTVLGAQSPLSLEALAAKLRLPKASVFRLLEALQAVGLVRKTPEKSYEALGVLRLLADERSLLRARIEKALPEICQTAGATAEWYETSGEGMRLVSQTHPDTEVRVQARPGFVRYWGEEFDAVARLGYAFDSQAPEPEDLYWYVGDGEREDVRRKVVHSLLAEAKAEGAAADPHFNTNGVRRCAVAVMENGKFRGVLALAEAFHFSKSKRKLSSLDVPKKSLREISR
jgi:DNA-binding IclR family transcriptional regulator